MPTGLVDSTYNGPKKTAEAVLNLQPCQPQEPVPQLQAGNPWELPQHVSPYVPLDDSGNYLIETLLPECYDNTLDDTLWDETMSAPTCATMPNPTLGASTYYRPDAYEDNTFDMGLSTFMGIGGGDIAKSTSTSPGFPMHQSNRPPPADPLIFSTLPTPTSSADKRTSRKRRASDDGDDGSTRHTSPPSVGSDGSVGPADRIVKRQRNTEAARRYRQRKVDRVAELEAALTAMTKERDDFKLKLARSEAEVDVLRRLVGKGN